MSKDKTNGSNGGSDIDPNNLWEAVEYGPFEALDCFAKDAMKEWMRFCMVQELAKHTRPIVIPYEEIAARSYRMAVAMLAERKKWEVQMQEEMELNEDGNRIESKSQANNSN